MVQAEAPGRTNRSDGLVIALGGFGLFMLVILASAAGAQDVGDVLTRNTVRLSLVWYAAALCLMMRLGAGDWNASTSSGRLARWCWTWACACFWVHVAMAFHWFHHWSHAAAFERTREVGGAGEGIYVSYTFALAWAADVMFWWWRPAAYAARSAWIDRTLHGFMLFVVYNGMVVFETGLIRWAGLVMFVVLALAWVLSRSRHISQTV